ncbi:MAG: hypothetical protein AAB036_01720 [Elusimicrobiota bacterium]
MSVQAGLLVLALMVSGVSSSWAQLRDYSRLKIAPHPSGGLYIGQYEWAPGDIAAVEKAGGRTAALWSKHWGWWSVGHDSQGSPHFDVSAANAAWNEGKAVLVSAYSVYPSPEETEAPAGFTVDKLLSGAYDADLHRFAGELRQFGKPLFFTTGREPNGAGADYFGGFGPLGNQSLMWALENKKGFAEFSPSGVLYAGIGSPAVCDGVERLKAAQRYYHDFFVRREGLEFLTFDTMGWAALDPLQIGYDVAGLPAHIDKTYAETLMKSCHDFANFYPGADYADWVSITFYMLDYLKKDFPELSSDIIVPIATHLNTLKAMTTKIEATAPGKPVFIMELGFPDSMNPDSQWAAAKISTGFPRIVSEFPSVKGFALWSTLPEFTVDFPYDCLIRPETKQGAALANVFASTPSKFRSCVYLSDGKPLPACRTGDPPSRPQGLRVQ